MVKRWSAGTALVTNANAWGTQGHQVIAGLASAQLGVQTRVVVNRLLALEPGATLASISTWADETRNPTTGPWHFVNFPRETCTYDAQRDCPNGQCIVGAIERQVEILESNAPDKKKLVALKYVVHLAADVHQPLHAGYQDDRGGNTYQLQAFMRGSNLHALWDVGLIRSLGAETDALTDRLLARAWAWRNRRTGNYSLEQRILVAGLPGRDFCGKGEGFDADRGLTIGAILAPDGCKACPSRVIHVPPTA